MMMLSINNLEPLNIIAYLLVVLLGTKEIWRLWGEKIKSNEKTELRRLDIEAKGREFARAAFQEYREKKDEEMIELKKINIELTKKNSDKDAIIVQLKQIVIRLDGFIKSMAHIVENNLKDESLKNVVQDIHEQAQQAVKLI